MQPISKLVLCLLLAATCTGISFTACRKENKTTRKITIQKPVYALKSAVLQSINGNAGTPVSAAGKIYIKDNYIFLNEIDKGIHIIDNSNPVHPVQIAFLSIPGNQDIAVKGDILYADMQSDLLAINISDPRKAKLTSLLPHVFTPAFNYYGNGPGDNYVITGWIEKDTLVSEADYTNIDYSCTMCGVFYSATASAASQSKGTAGSMAKMVLVNDYLYMISERHSLGIVDIHNAQQPRFVSSMTAGFDLETIYPFQQKLFLGSAVGTFMFDIGDPEHPLALGQFEHGRACDPVVANEKYAYVTLHTGSACGDAQNLLNVVDVTDLLHPRLVRAYDMTKPMGLCQDGDLLFVCDGSSGVKVFDIRNPEELGLLQTIKSRDPYDVIASNNRAFVVTRDGISQYDYSNMTSIRLLSHFAISN